MALNNSNVVPLFPKSLDTTQSTGLRKTVSTKLLALVDAPRDGIQGSIIHFTHPVENTDELLELIDKLKWMGTKDITVKAEDGTIINNCPEYAL